MSTINDLLERVRSPGAFRDWRHPRRELNETSIGTIDLKHLLAASRQVYDYSQTLIGAMRADNHEIAARSCFAIMQNLYPIVEALDADSAKYLAQAVEQLRRP